LLLCHQGKTKISINLCVKLWINGIDPAAATSSFWDVPPHVWMVSLTWWHCRLIVFTLATFNSSSLFYWFRLIVFLTDASGFLAGLFWWHHRLTAFSSVPVK